jgi:hypothetical protein
MAPRMILTFFRHPRESGGPAVFKAKRDSRWRGNDGIG